MTFKFSDALAALITALGLVVSDVEAKFAALAAEFPDAAAFEQAVKDWLDLQVAPALPVIPVRILAEAKAAFAAGGKSPVSGNDSSLA